MTEKIISLRTKIETDLKQATDLADLETLRVSVLGKKGEITNLLKSLSQLPPDERRQAGQAANELRDWATLAIADAKGEITAREQANSLATESIDVTLPGRRRTIGRHHPISTTHTQLENLFTRLGFSILEGPHIETVYHNFDALNSPQNHPSRDETDTFYFSDELLLRCHTSPMQIRVMKTQAPPIRIVVPGMTFRRDEIDATHTPAFHQMEGLVVDKGIHFGNLKGMLELIVKELFGPEAQIRLRPSHFPFTEPSAEVDITCYSCKAKTMEGCRVCKGSGWVELWGCGMVHPQVLQNCGIDPTVYSGYAFGLGTDRLTSAVYGITDPRLYFENDMQFLCQF
ncbi:MAG: phenylalanine--tRNA ligase subunit alpha [Defluviitaleaceae bacterium]|nr:phenylalanine--tRNA ligase subunit alpha [Defluviitaleaceae bacterium]